MKVVQNHGLLAQGTAS